MSSTELINAVIRGIETGSVYAIFALGLMIVFQTTGIFNFAHGELFMVGGVLGVVLWESFDVRLFAAFGLVLAACALAGGLTEIMAVRPALRYKHSEAWVLSTLGIGLVISNAFAWAVVRGESTGVRVFPRYLPLERVYHVGGVIVETDRVFVVIVALASAVALSLFLRKTRYGRGLRAVASDREGAIMRGLPVKQLGLISFAIGGALGGLGGFVTAPVTQASVFIGLSMLIKGFIAGAVGGFAQISGCVIGGMVLGLTEQLTAVYTNGRYDKLATLVLLLAVLSVKPAGITGGKVRVV